MLSQQLGAPRRPAAAAACEPACDCPIDVISICDLQARYCRHNARYVNRIRIDERILLVSDGPEPATPRGRGEGEIFWTTGRDPTIQAICRLQDAASGRRQSIEAHDGSMAEESRTGPLVGDVLAYHRRAECFPYFVSGGITFQLVSPHQRKRACLVLSKPNQRDVRSSDRFHGDASQIRHWFSRSVCPDVSE
jgi:hypothetical protein